MLSLKLFLPPVYLFLLFSCSEKKETRIARLAEEWLNKEIRFPEQVTFVDYKKDTFPYAFPPAPYKAIIYVDSIGCLSCKLQLAEWKKMIRQVDSVTNGSVPFLFFLHSNDSSHIRYLLKRAGFERPVCMDTAGVLNRLNRFPSDEAFHTFLVNRQNRVVLIGNPIHNPAVKDLYLSVLTGYKSQPDGLQTTARIERPFIDLGTCTTTDLRTSVAIRNTGNNPLLVLDVSKTCDCMEVTYDKQPAAPGDSIFVHITLSGKKPGAFHETLFIRCNTEKLISYRIRGEISNEPTVSGAIGNIP